MAFATTFHDLLDPLSGARTSIRIEQGRLAERGADLPRGEGRDLEGADWWVLPAIYDADAHMPLVEVGLRESDRALALHGGVSRVNVALQWQDIVGLDLEALFADLTRWALPRITPILSVHSDRDSTGFGPWLADNAELVRTLMPPVCKLYSYGDGFWENLETVAAAGLLPIIYCKDFADVEQVVAKSPVPVHFRHAVSEELVRTMKGLEGATLQTSPHFLLPVADEVREQLFVLPPVGGTEQREAFAPLVLDEIDFIVTDNNAPPLQHPTGPGLQVQQNFLGAMLTARNLYDWPLERVWEKLTTAPAERFGVELEESFVIVDPSDEHVVGRWEPRQTPDRAPYAGSTLTGRVLAVGNADAVELV
jgi:hypothetical protein